MDNFLNFLAHNSNKIIFTGKLRYKASPFMEKKEKKFLLANPINYKKR